MKNKGNDNRDVGNDGNQSQQNAGNDLGKKDRNPNDMHDKKGNRNEEVPNIGDKNKENADRDKKDEKRDPNAPHRQSDKKEQREQEPVMVDQQQERGRDKGNKSK
jgi:hypothetical protein